MPKNLTARDALEAVAQAPVFLTINDPDGRVLWHNRYGYGHDADAVLGARGDDLLLGEGRDAFTHARRLALTLGEASWCRGRLATPGGPPAELVMRVGPLRRGGRVVGTVTAAWDAALGGPGGEAAGPAVPARFVLGDLGRRVVALLLESGPLKGGAVGARVGESTTRGQASNRLRAKLASLCERGVLSRSPAGYEVSEAFRPHAPAALAG